ncbi:MAG: tetratricopeptide repeat protein [Ignavibacteria bacterium]|nr:tetratricopeptide repeat protein [Ignavibacteria bacterium]
MDYKLEHKIKTATEFEAKGKFLHAVQIYQTFINNYLEICEPYINLADLYHAKGQKENAEKLLKIIITREPDNYEVVLYYAQFLMQNKEWDSAVVKLLDVSLDESFLSYLIGYCYYRLGNCELARVHILQFIISDAEPELIQEVYYLLAKIELDLKQYENAL